MSYCRWSSDNWKSDVYCYESGDGYVTHVANSKHVFDEELQEVDLSAEDWLKQEQKVMKLLKRSKLVAIGLPEDGKTYCDADLQSFHNRLVFLKELGYHVPDSAFDKVDRETKGE